MNDCPKGEFCRPTRSADGIAILFDRLGTSAEAGEAAEYRFVIWNGNDRSVAVRLRPASDEQHVMSPEVTPGRFRLEPGGESEGKITVTVPEVIPPGGFEEQRLRLLIDNQESPADEFVLTTARHLPHPYLMHTEEGWRRVKEKIRKHDWAEKVFQKLVEKAGNWTVPDIHPSGLYVFEAWVAGSGILRDTIVAWKLTGNRVYARKAVEFLLKLSDPERGFPETMRAVSRYAVKQGTLFRQVGMAYDLLCGTDVLSESEHDQIRRTLRLFIRQWSGTEEYLLQDMRPYLDNSRIGNHPLSVVVGAVMCALALQDLNHVKRYLWGPGGFEQQMSRGIMDDGFWFETDPGYHSLVTGFFWKIAQACRPWGYNLFDRWVRPSYLRHVGLRKESGVDPSGRRLSNGTVPTRLLQGPSTRNRRTLKDMFDCLIPLADYRRVVFANNKSGELCLEGCIERAYTRYPDPDFAWALGRRRGGFDALLYGPGEIPERSCPRPTVATAENAGLYVLRSSVGEEDEPRQQIQAVLKAGSHGHGHGHFDQTNLLSIMRYGRSFYRTEAVLDWKYDVPVQNGWLKKSANHNMILVDRGNQGFAESKKLFTHDGEMFRAAAVQATAPWRSHDGESTEPIRHRRLMLVTDDYIVVADSVGSAQGPGEADEHIFDWMIHPVGFQDASERTFVRRDERFAEDGACRFITDCEWSAYEGPLHLRFAQHFEDDPPNEDGVLMLEIHSPWPPTGQLMLGQYPEGQKEGSQQRRSVSLRSKGKHARYLAVIEPHEGEPLVTGVSAPGPDELRVELADGRTHVFRIDGFAEPKESPRVMAQEWREGAPVEEERTVRPELGWD